MKKIIFLFFLTLSQAQLKWNELLVSIFKTMKHSKYKWIDPIQKILDKMESNNITIECIESLEDFERRCLVINNIQQVTQHFQRRVQKIFQALKEKNFLLMNSAEICKKNRTNEECDLINCSYCTNINKINCFSNEGGDWKNSKLNYKKDKIEVIFTEKFIPRRGRINCSMQDKDGWRWFGTQFTLN